METTILPAPTTRPWQRPLLAFLDTVLLLTIVLMVCAWFFNPVVVDLGIFDFSASWGAKTYLPPIALLAARIALVRAIRHAAPAYRGLGDRAIYKKTCLAILSPFVALLLLEGVAGLLGVKALPSAPIVVTGGEAEDTTVENNRILRDPELLFAFNPGIDWGGYRINSLGHRTREFTREKPPGTMRLIAMGDSCTAQGLPPYSDRLHDLLQQDPPTSQPWESYNTGVFGYSLLQGHRQFQKHVRHYQPDIVTIYFGWNDHWLYDKPDDQRLAIRMNPAAAASIAALREKKFFALLAGLAKPPEPQQSAEDGKTFRVPQPRYAETLKMLIADIRAVGAQPLVITAPRRDLDESLVRAGYGRSTDEAETAHDEYVELTRQVARETGAEVLDLAAIFAPAEFDRYFTNDGIHFTEEGLQRIAEILHAKLKAMAAAGRLGG